MSNRICSFIVVTPLSILEVKQRSGLRHVLSEILRRNPNEIIEVYEPVLRPELAPTEGDRGLARTWKVKQAAKEEARKISVSRTSDEARLAALEEERELLRIRLGWSD